MDQVISERLQCPARYQDLITRLTGKNRFGGPNFRLVWGQTDWRLMVNATGGYERRLTGFDQPCWIIQKWTAPEQYGVPELYYSQTYDDFSGKYLCGEFPYKGRYETVQPLLRKTFIDGALKIEHFPLSSILIDKIIPLIQQAQAVTIAQREAAEQAEAARDNKEKVDKIADSMMAELPSFYGPVSFSRQGMRTSLLDRKMQEIQQKWNLISHNAKPGLYQGRK